MAVKKRESAETIQSKLGTKHHDNRDTSTEDRIAADTARYEALAREHGADLSEEGFNEALRKVGDTKSARKV